MSRRTAALSLASIALVALVCVALLVPMPYVVMSPGLTENTLGEYEGEPVVSITGERTYPTSGHLDLTTVSVTSPEYEPRLPDILAAWWSPNDIVLPRDLVYPPEQTVGEVKQENRDQMDGSQAAAIMVGLAQAGYDATDVTVSEIVEGAPADDVLEKGDVIESVNGAQIAVTDDLIVAISDLEPGTEVSMGIVRGGEPRTVDLRTEPSPEDESASRVGIFLADVFDPPFKVDIELGQSIGGPSAGLMFSLAIYDLLTPGKLTGGRYVAGTGTIDASGVVGPIGGIEQKIVGAHANGATVFLVPAADCPDAAESDLADDIDLIEVTTIDDAVTALEGLASGDGADIPRCGSGAP
ncbi:MAG: PDZ domain-containing protein [Nocardioidaceae bacterium]|nr:PDZ domain-containing protein [Nocardioidaceae bacterium]